MTEQPQINHNENNFRTNAEIDNDRIMKEQAKYNREPSFKFKPRPLSKEQEEAKAWHYAWLEKEQQKSIVWERKASSFLKPQGSTQDKVRELKKEAVKNLINQIKDHIVEIGLVDGINFYDLEGNLDWSKVNNYIE